MFFSVTDEAIDMFYILFFSQDQRNYARTFFFIFA